jgi:hypothetical protein
MLIKHQSTGMTGLYLVAAELSSRGFIVTVTSRSAQGADLLVTDGNCHRAFAVQVKTNITTFRAWFVNKKTSTLKSRHMVYAFVNLTKKGPAFYLVPSKFVAQNVKTELASKTRKGDWFAVMRNVVERYEDNWKIFNGGKEPPRAYEIYRPKNSQN